MQDGSCSVVSGEYPSVGSVGLVLVLLEFGCGEPELILILGPAFPSGDDVLDMLVLVRGGPWPEADCIPLARNQQCPPSASVAGPLMSQFQVGGEDVPVHGRCELLQCLTDVCAGPSGWHALQNCGLTLHHPDGVQSP